MEVDNWEGKMLHRGEIEVEKERRWQEGAAIRIWGRKGNKGQEEKCLKRDCSSENLKIKKFTNEFRHQMKDWSSPSP